MKIEILTLLSLVVASFPRRNPYDGIHEIENYFVECYGDTFNEDYQIDIHISGFVFIRALHEGGNYNPRLRECWTNHYLNYYIGLSSVASDPRSFDNYTDSEEWSSESSVVNEGPWDEMLRLYPSLSLKMACDELEVLPTFVQSCLPKSFD
ncbi:hypothetical protein DICA0_E40580 [Diutina catenulata]